VLQEMSELVVFIPCIKDVFLVADTMSALRHFILAGVQKLQLFLSYWHVEEGTTVY
jgi:hypothetical protein